ncbi:phosphatidylserine/phosphatidylglycerophosphate/cardiolipin synthase family protein [uncultured Acetatifactor sp.]|uniref:phospholipase D-like domain-containing protein n=1 Tax=uncultured Acetatifactor sp. TaxID=1671927 RepID=UPI002611045C|nr:phospholipase D family protein [uncultured Acetatifactor sp.]
MKKHRLRNRLIVLFLLLAYVCAIVLPYARQPAVTAATIEGFTASDFYGDSDTGQRARIISDNGEALAERIRLISQAEEEIILSTFDFNADDSGKMLLAALLSASQRGVHVSLLVDGLAYATGILGNPWFRALTREENVELKVYNPLNPLKPWNLMGRLHDKYLIADRTAYILGGRNCYDFFLGDHDGYKNYDWDVLVCCEDAGAFPSLDQLLEYFRSVWALDECHAVASRKEGKQEELLALYSRMQEEHADWFLPVDYKELTVPARRVRLVSNPIGPQVKEPVVFYTITELMEQAEESVSIHTPYILCDDWMLGQLADICISVPEVTMMTNSVANNGNPFGAMDYYANKEKLLGSGVGMLEYDSGVSYHGKCFTIDDRIAAVGSFNWDMRSAYLDTELMLVIDSPQLNRQLREAMGGYEQDALRVIDADSYDLAEGQTPQPLTPSKERRLKLLYYLAYWARFLM